MFGTHHWLIFAHFFRDFEDQAISGMGPLPCWLRIQRCQPGQRVQTFWASYGGKCLRPRVDQGTPTNLLNAVQEALALN